MTERMHEVLVALHSDQVSKQFQQDIREGYQESYEEAKTEGVLGVLRLWGQDFRKDIETVCKDRVHRGQGRQLMLLFMLLALVGIICLYGSLALLTGLLCFVLFGFDLHEQITSSASVLGYAQVPIYAADILSALLFTGVAWGAWLFAKKTYKVTFAVENA